MCLFFEVRAVRQRVRAYLQRPIIGRVLPAYSTEVAMPIRSKVVPPPPVEARVDALEEGLHRAMIQIVESKLDVTKKLREEISETARALADDVRDELRDLAALVLDLNDEADQALAVTGAAFVVIGLVLSAIGSVWSASP